MEILILLLLSELLLTVLLLILWYSIHKIEKEIKNLKFLLTYEKKVSYTARPKLNKKYCSWNNKKLKTNNKTMKIKETIIDWDFSK